MNVAVTGGSGQLGTLVLRRLIDDRSVKAITSLDVRPPALVDARLRAVQADVRAKDFYKHLEGCDALVHLAFVVTRHMARDVVQAINVEGSKNVFHAAAEAGVPRVVYASSIAAYGVLPGHPIPIVEDTPRRLNAAFAYSATKYEVEEFLDAFEREHPEVAIARLRPSILVGRRMDHSMGQSMRRRVLTEVIGSNAPLPIVWDEDVADAAILALKQGARGAFNLSADEPLPAAELARATGFKLARVPRDVALGLAKLSPYLERAGLGDAVDPAWVENLGVPMVVSSARARRKLGWKPRCPTAVDVVQMFDKTVPRGVDPRIATFFRLADWGARRAQVPPDMAHVAARVHVALTGPRGGDFALTVDRGTLSVKPGVPRPPTSVLTLPAQVLLDLLAGKVDFATVQLTGKLRIEGEPTANMLLMDLLAMFRTRTAKPGVQGWVTRRMSDWFARA